jgi:hypothetical protein
VGDHCPLRPGQSRDRGGISEQTDREDQISMIAKIGAPITGKSLPPCSSESRVGCTETLRGSSP